MREGRGRGVLRPGSRCSPATAPVRNHNSSGAGARGYPFFSTGHAIIGWVTHRNDSRSTPAAHGSDPAGSRSQPHPSSVPVPGSNRLPVPGPSPESEAQRRRDLRKHKAIATGLLLFAAGVFIICRILDHNGDAHAAVGYVQAAAEAGMVGGLADWFAVTALFRHPLSIPIPHTAIIKRKKDQVGHSLSEFVGENFLNATLISEKLRDAHVPVRVAEWVVNDGGDQRISQEAGNLLRIVVKGLREEEAEAIIQTLVVDRVREPQWGPPMGRGLQQLIDEGRTEPIVDAVVEWADKKARASEHKIVELIDERTPRWAPRFVRELMGERVYREVVQFTAEVRANPHHEARIAFRRFIAKLADDLQNDPTMIARVEKYKDDIFDSGPLKALPATIWSSVRDVLLEQATTADSTLRTRITQWSHDFAQRVLDEPELQEKLEARVVRAASYLADNYADQITGIIGDTVERWDADEASDRIELMVGKDLQFIRVNGTIVGALAGLAIYSIAQLILAIF